MIKRAVKLAPVALPPVSDHCDFREGDRPGTVVAGAAHNSALAMFANSDRSPFSSVTWA